MAADSVTLREDTHSVKAGGQSGIVTTLGARPQHFKSAKEVSRTLMPPLLLPVEWNKHCALQSSLQVSQITLIT